MSFKDTLVKYFYKGTMWASEHSAEICTGVAVVTSVSAAGMMIKATKDVLPELEQHKENIGAIKDSYNAENQEYLSLEVFEGVDGEPDANVVPVYGDEAKKLYSKDLRHEYGRTTLTIAKRYAIPVALEITAVATIISSNKISRKKNAALATSLTAVQAMYDRYRQNVIDAVGEETERDIRLGLHNEKVTVESEDENGKKKKTKEDVKVMDPDKCADDFVRIFDESSSLWNKSKGVNRDILYIKQCHWNERLIRRGYVFLNEVLEDLDLPCSEVGQYYGWIYDDTDTKGYHNCVEFTYDEQTPMGKAFQLGQNPSVILEFKPDGHIADKIWPSKPKFIKKAFAGANY